MEFDKWELLAAFQALLVYCLLRIQEVPIDNGSFETALLTTVNVSERCTNYSMRCTLTITKACIQRVNVVDWWDPQVRASR